jgi:hypothetical protein
MPEEMNPAITNCSADANPSKLMELLRKKVDEELAAPSQASTGMSLTPNLNRCLEILGIRASLVF